MNRKISKAAAVAVLLVLAFIAAAFSATAFVTAGYANSDFFYHYKTIEYNTSADLKSKTSEEKISVGVVTDTANLNFGFIPADGAFIKRIIEIENTSPKKAEFGLSASGSMAPLVEFEPQSGFLRPGEKIAVNVFLMPVNASAGHYEGKITATIKMPRF